MMGSDTGNNNEKPVHQVTVKRFFISKYQVTQVEIKPIRLVIKWETIWGCTI